MRALNAGQVYTAPVWSLDASAMPAPDTSLYGERALLAAIVRAAVRDLRAGRGEQFQSAMAFFFGAEARPWRDWILRMLGLETDAVLERVRQIEHWRFGRVGDRE